MRSRLLKNVRSAWAFTKTFSAARLTLFVLFCSSGSLLSKSALLIFVSEESIESLAARAEQFESNGNWEGAKSAYREILKIDPRSIAALNRLGAIEVRLQRFDEGIAYYKQALDLNPF